ncbi:MAG: class I SAM-dependent methyltransferase [Ktedonobacteraceae bacterium]|nr:class I SAM-dependent methyltransferase [Chloroflexota bacterium]
MVPDSPQGENTYFIDAQSAAEMTRLVDFDQYVTQAMGGALSEHSDLSTIHSLLDIACGPGSWLLEVASANPEIQAVGVDINRIAISYANGQAKVRGLHNASFRAMNALEPLDFPDASFDLVNVRNIGGFMPPEGWPAFLEECMRILRPGGTLRLTEGEWGMSNKPAFAKLNGMITRALQKSGRSFSPDGRHYGMLPMLGHFLSIAGCRDIQRQSYVIDYSAGQEANAIVYQDAKVFGQLIQPFLITMGITTKEEGEQVYQEAMAAMLLDDFRGLVFLLTVWGQKA